MRISRFSWLALAAALWTTPALAQARDACLHSGVETPDEARRREEGLAAARLINSMTAGNVRLPNQPRYQTWEQLAGSQQVGTLRGMGGPLGDLARKIQWGGDEPLPGWRIHHVISATGFAISLLDTRDPCGFTYYSNESGVVVEGYPVVGTRRGGLQPIT
jgi:hypothetical protein